MLIDKQQRQSVTMEVELEESVAAPVSQGQRLGTMTVKAGEQVLSQIPLVAVEAVERQSLGALFVKVLKRAAMAG
jgi:D-alanyl-D-alanine carboxypeptidase (penicillin-binding protein 5/6)